MFLDPRFWLTVSFTIFFVLVLKFILPKILKALDNKSKQITDDMEQAKKMREKAEELLLAAKKYHEESLTFCQKLLDDAKKEAEQLLIDSKNELAAELAKKTSLAQERIKQEEEKTIREMKTNIIAAAIKTIEAKSQTLSTESSSLIAQKAAIDISKMVH